MDRLGVTKIIMPYSNNINNNTIVCGWFNNKDIIDILKRDLNEKDTKQVEQLLNFTTDTKNIGAYYGFNQYFYDDYLKNKVEKTYDAKYGPYYKIRYLQNYVNKVNIKRITNLKINFYRPTWDNSSKRISYMLYFGDHDDENLMSIDKIDGWKNQIERLKKLDDIPEAKIRSFDYTNYNKLGQANNLTKKSVTSVKAIPMVAPGTYDYDNIGDLDDLLEEEEEMPKSIKKKAAAKKPATKKPATKKFVEEEDDSDIVILDDNAEDLYDWGDKNPMKELV